VITQAAKLFTEIVYPKVDTPVKQITVGIDLRWKTPFLTLKFRRDGFFEALKIPAPENKTARGNKEKSDECDVKDSNFGLFQTQGSKTFSYSPRFQTKATKENRAKHLPTLFCAVH
jgi:hypothetical protein